MDRLTNNQGVLIECIDCSERYDCYDYDCGKIEEAIKTLSMYEDTGLAPEGVQELKERDAEKAPRKNSGYYACPTCGAVRSIRQKRGFCHDCGQRLKWED